MIKKPSDSRGFFFCYKQLFIFLLFPLKSTRFYFFLLKSSADSCIFVFKKPKPLFYLCSWENLFEINSKKLFKISY